MELLGYGGAHLLVGRRRGIDGREDRLARAHAPPGVAAHVHEVAHVVFGHTGYDQLVPVAHGIAHLVLVEERYSIARRKSVLHGKLLGHQNGVVVKGERLARQAVLEGDGPGHLPHVARHHHVHADGLVVAVGRRLHVLVLHAHDAGHLAAILQAAHHAMHVELDGLVIEAHRRVKVNDGPILAVDDVPDGVVQAKANEQQGRAAGDADDRHEEAPLVTEEVAEGNLPGKGEAAPHGDDALEQDALARLGRARQHEGGRHLTQARDDRAPGSQQRDAHTQAARSQRDAQIDGQRERVERDRVDDGVRAHDDEGQHLREDHDAHGGPHHARYARVGEVLCRNGARAVSQGLVGTNEHAVVLDHAGHGGQRDQRCHQKEDEREHVGNGVDAARVGMIGGCTLALGAVERVDVGKLDLVDLALGVLQLLQRVGKALVRLGLALFVLAQAVGILRAPVLELGACVFELGSGVVELLLATRKLARCGCSALRQLAATGVQLGLALVELAGTVLDLVDGPEPLAHLRQAVRQLRQAVVDLGYARIYLGDALLELGDARVCLVEGGTRLPLIHPRRRDGRINGCQGRVELPELGLKLARVGSCLLHRGDLLRQPIALTHELRTALERTHQLLEPSHLLPQSLGLRLKVGTLRGKSCALGLELRLLGGELVALGLERRPCIP